MVVCRLRRNKEFHLNENQGSDEGGSTAVDNSAPSLSGVDQSPLVDGAKTAGSCSKDCSSSLNSHSVEQLDTGSESEEKVTNESSHPVSSLRVVCINVSSILPSIHEVCKFHDLL